MGKEEVVVTAGSAGWEEAYVGYGGCGGWELSGGDNAELSDTTSKTQTPSGDDDYQLRDGTLQAALGAQLSPVRRAQHLLIEATNSTHFPLLP